SSSSKLKSAILIKAQLPVQSQYRFESITKAHPVPYNPNQCPCCKKETMETVMRFNRRGPPFYWKELAAELLDAMKGLTLPVQYERNLQLRAGITIQSMQQYQRERQKKQT